MAVCAAVQPRQHQGSAGRRRRPQETPRQAGTGRQAPQASPRPREDTGQVRQLWNGEEYVNTQREREIY